MISHFLRTNLLNYSSKANIASTFNLLHTSQIYQKRKKSKSCGSKKIAMVLSGCGALDGTEITEAISATIHLSKKGFEPKFFAPDINICAPVNHLTQEVDTCGDRNALVESARIARSNIKQLCECKTCDYAALIIPGGFGAARTLSDFASKGCNCVILPDLIRIIGEFQCGNKPIGGICIAAALLPKVLKGARVTLGKDDPKDRYIYASAIEKVKQMGGCIEMHDAKGVAHCKRYNIFTTPAFMDTYATPADVHEGIGKMISMMSKIIK